MEAHSWKVEPAPTTASVLISTTIEVTLVPAKVSLSLLKLSVLDESVALKPSRSKKNGSSRRPAHSRRPRPGVWVVLS